MNDGYLSRDRQHLNAQQRARRQRMRRLDYMPSNDAIAIIESKRAQFRPGSVHATNSAVLDAILIEWAKLTGINYRKVSTPMTSTHAPELFDRYARAYDFGRLAAIKSRPTATYCGARTKAGTACRAKPLPGARRCKWHGGLSTGPKTPEGKARALSNLRQFHERTLGESIGED